MATRGRGRPRKTKPPETFSRRVGEQIRFQRCLRELSVIEVAADLDVDVGTWWRWEAGDSEIPLNLLPAIAAAVHCRVADLIPQDEPATRESRGG